MLDYYGKYQTADSLVTRSKIQLMQADSLIDSLVTQTQIYKVKLDSCQALKNGN